jgi:3-phosphoshikimate 1-carboxyvinyltransferase
MTTHIEPAHRPLEGVVRLPGDKSLSHRALLLGALAQGGFVVSGLSSGADVMSTASVLRSLGVALDPDGAGNTIVQGPGGARPVFDPPKHTLDCGNSGTTMRLMMGILAGQPFESTLIGDASLSRRPMRRVADPLLRMGARVTMSPEGTAPVQVGGGGPLQAIDYLLPVGSAQVKSAVLLAGLFAQGTTIVRDPFGSRDHTERAFMALAMDDSYRWDGEVSELRGGAGLQGNRRAVRVPGDPSSAAFWAVAALMVPGSDVTVEGVCLNPSRIGWVRALLAMGAPIQVDQQGLEAGEPVGTIRAQHGPLRGVHLTEQVVPSLIDEVPILAVAAALAQGVTVIEGLAELRHKESDRLARIVEGLRAIGATADARGDNLHIAGGAKFTGGHVDTDADHRIAMAFAVAALASTDAIALSDAECVKISYPGFFAVLESLRKG